MSLLNKNADASQLKHYAVYASIATAFLLTFIKALAAFITGSLSILSSMADSLADVISSLITFIAVHFSDKPLTCDHRYGYGKAEAVSALVQAAFISGSACFILYEAVYRLIHPVVLTHTAAGIYVMIISVFITAALIWFQRRIIRRVHSQAVEADSKHYVIDLLSNVTVLLSLAIVRFLKWEWFDILAAIFVSAYLIFTAWHIAQKALSEITDKEADADIKMQITKTVLQIDGVKGYHDFRSRLSGNRLFLEMHLELDGNLSLFAAHEISDKAENAITALYPHAQVIIHQDPYGLKEKRIDYDIIGPCEL